MAHIVLLGDSIFDNLRYVQPGPDVLAQLRAMLPAGWNASLRAVDGAVINNVEEQLADLPPDATHLVLSVGGNDLLGYGGELLRKPVAASSEVFLLLARVAVAAFNDAILRLAREKGLPSIDLRLVCAQAEDYANPIEPSVIGGEKIAGAIWRTISSET